MTPGQAIAAKLKAFREGRRLSQNELAERADLSYPAIQKLESGKGNPGLDTLYKLAGAGIPIAELFSSIGGEPVKEKPSQVALIKALAELEKENADLSDQVNALKAQLKLKMPPGRRVSPQETALLKRLDQSGPNLRSAFLEAALRLLGALENYNEGEAAQILKAWNVPGAKAAK